NGGPADHGTRPAITVTMDLEHLQAMAHATGFSTAGFGGGSGGFVARYDSGNPVHPADLRRYLCDAFVIPAVLNSDSVVLDIGRGQRLFPPTLRAAIIQRDTGCTWPGCDRPASWCDAHHVIPWVEGGNTAVENGCL